MVLWDNQMVLWDSQYVLFSLAEKGIPDFWFTALKNTDLFTEMIKVSLELLKLPSLTYQFLHMYTC